MPIATIQVVEGRYDERRLSHVSKAVQDALISVPKIPSDDFFQVIHVLPRNRFLHSPSFLGMRYSDDLILLEVAFAGTVGDGDVPITPASVSGEP